MENIQAIHLADSLVMGRNTRGEIFNSAPRQGLLVTGSGETVLITPFYIAYLQPDPEVFSQMRVQDRLYKYTHADRRVTEADLRQARHTTVHFNPTGRT